MKRAALTANSGSNPRQALGILSQNEMVNCDLQLIQVGIGLRHAEYEPCVQTTRTDGIDLLRR
jgi:hypothetical protein